jgi:hypothetical protein
MKLSKKNQVTLEKLFAKYGHNRAMLSTKIVEGVDVDFWHKELVAAAEAVKAETGIILYPIKPIVAEEPVLMDQKSIKRLKVGDFFKFQETYSSPVWVRGEYDQAEGRFECHKFDDVNHSKYFSGFRIIFTGFTF